VQGLQLNQPAVPAQSGSVSSDQGEQRGDSDQADAITGAAGASTSAAAAAAAALILTGTSAAAAAPSITAPSATAAGASIVAGAGIDSAGSPAPTVASAGSATQRDAAVLATLNSLSAGADADASGIAAAASAGTDGTQNDSSATAGSSVAGVAAGNMSELIHKMTPPAFANGVERTIELPVSDRNWSNEVAGQVQWMVKGDIQSATLKLSPEHLGPVEVHIDVQSSQVNVTFSAAHADTRAALTQSVPALRDLMASGGLTLGQASVNQEQRSSQQYPQGVSRTAVSVSQSVDPVAHSPMRMLGLLDEYA
jgi:flagellar hook-length control protein FliK